ncbi:MAG: hypothetical protein V1858_02915 [Candidatus Gottesmanbacteria bacterium]
MTEIIYKTKFFCNLCKKDIPLELYGNKNTEFTRDQEPEIITPGKHYHWVDFHRVCAICGQPIKAQDLTVAMNDGMIKINENYTDEYNMIEQGNKFGVFLIVHKECVKNIKF